MKRLFYLVVCLGLLSYTVADGQKITVATYNVRYDNKGDIEKGNDWKQRYPVIAGMVRFHGFDIFGTQEGLQHQLEDLKGSLPGFTFIGVGSEAPPAILAVIGNIDPEVLLPLDDVDH